MFGAARQKLGSAEGKAAEAARTAVSGPASKNNWTELVNGVRNRDDAALEELYRLFSKGVRYFLYRQLGTQDIEDRLHDTFLAVVQAIQRGDLREPERLMGFVKTVAHRQAVAGIVQNVQDREHLDIEAGFRIADTQQNPEQSILEKERSEIVREALRKVPARDREILTRFYVLEESQQHIRKAMKLTETQYRLLKSRAKARLGEAGKKRIVQNPIAALFLRKNENTMH